MRRVAFSMTIDPDGAMHDWVNVPAGWSLLRVPTQEAVHLLGIHAYQELLVDLCARERPDLLVTHPPYDYLSLPVAERLRAAGTRLVAYAFDDEIFARAYTPATHAALARVYDRYVTTREVRWATAPSPALPELAPEHDVALVGTAYPRRQALVDSLRAAGVSVATRGHGWPEGFASRARMLDLYARAAVVLTTADWEHEPVPMVKHRLLDTAMLGAFQISQDAPDLRAYFPDDEVPAYRDADELVARVRAALLDPAGRRRAAAAARARALTEHTWSARFPELIAGLDLGDERPPGEPARLLEQTLLALATRAESDGRPGAAEALYAEVLARDAGEPTAAAGRGRCLRLCGRPEEALPWLRRAAAAEPPVCAGALFARIPARGVGAGLGALGLFPPAAEPLVYLCAALLELGRVDEAAAVLDGIADPVVARAVAATLGVGDDPALTPVAVRLARMRG